MPDHFLGVEALSKFAQPSRNRFLLIAISSPALPPFKPVGGDYTGLLLIGLLFIISAS